MNRNSKIFFIVLLLFLAIYLVSSYRFVVYNNSGQTIQKMTITSRWLNREIKNVKDQEVMHFSIFAPFKKQVRISVENPNQIRSGTFELHQALSEKYNQVEIGFGCEIKCGELGF